jgi:hypothetical protein
MFNLGFGIPNRPAPAFGVNGFQISSMNYQWVHTLAANPTTRPDGSALIIGDQIQDPATGEMWRWNGTLWLSPEFQVHSFINSFGNNSSFNAIFDAPIGRDVFVKEVFYAYIPAGTVNTTATATITTTLRTLGASSTVLFTQPIPLGTNFATGVRTSRKQPAGVTAPRTVVANASGVALNTVQTLGFTLSSFSFGLRGSLVR